MAVHGSSKGKTPLFVIVGSSAIGLFVHQLLISMPICFCFNHSSHMCSFYSHVLNLLTRVDIMVPESLLIVGFPPGWY